MRRTFLFLIVLFPFAAFAQDEFPRSLDLKVNNPSTENRESVFLNIPLSRIKAEAPDFNEHGFIVVDGGKEIPSQYLKGDSRGIAFVLTAMSPSEERVVSIKYHTTRNITRNYPRMTQAELSHKAGGEWKGKEYVGGAFRNVDFLRVPERHRSHSWYIRYEGPGWESDKVAYRLYLDERNAIDVFGKTVHEPVLQMIGVNNFESYHELQPWGMDIMKVGNSLGVGSVGYRFAGNTSRVEITDSISCRILANGPVYSAFQTNYNGWKVGKEQGDLTVHTSIHAGTRLSGQLVTYAGLVGNFCTGIIKDKNAELISDLGDESSFGFLCTYGKQSLNGDDLGLVVFFDPKDVQEMASDDESYLVVFKQGKNPLKYFFAAAWSQEKDGITNREDFFRFVERTAKELSNPVVVK